MTTRSNLMRKVPRLLACMRKHVRTWPPGLRAWIRFACNLRLQGIQRQAMPSLQTSSASWPDQVRLVEVPLEALRLDQARGAE